MSRLLIVFILALTGGPVSEPVATGPSLTAELTTEELTTEERGDAAWRRRAAGFPEVLDPEPTRTAATAYEEALDADPHDLGVLLKLMEAVYFERDFLTADRARQIELDERLVALSDRALAEVARRAGTTTEELDALPLEERADRIHAAPEAARTHFWSAISWGLWGMSHSRWAAATHGVAGRIRDHARMVVLLDETFADAGGLRLLGRLHSLTPRVPFVTGWIDREAGIEHLRRANEISRRDPRNPLFLAEALLAAGDASRAEALELLREVAGRSPSPDWLAEESRTLDEARAVLAREEKR